MSEVNPNPTNDDSDSSGSKPPTIEYRSRKRDVGCLLVVIAVGACSYMNFKPVPMVFYSGDISEATCEYLAEKWTGEEMTRNTFGGEVKYKILTFTDVRMREHSEKELVCRGTARTDSRGKLDFKMTLEEDPDGSQWHHIEIWD